MEIEMKVDEFGHKYYCKDGELHREDGPAVVWVYGCKEW